MLSEDGTVKKRRYKIFKIVKGKWRFVGNALLTTQRMIEVSLRSDHRLEEIPLFEVTK